MRAKYLALLILLFECLLSGCKRQAASVPADSSQELVIPEHGIYTGAYMDFGDNEDDVTLDTIDDFEAMVGKHQAIIASSSYWGEQTFPSRNVEIIWRHGSVPLLFWSPWDRPYMQDRGPDRFSLQEIIKGTWDNYIDRWADGARAFGQPLIVSFANEMNGNWFPWSGWFYGGNKKVPGQPGKYYGPETFKQAYRHVVDRVRARGATNILWLFHTNNYAEPNDNWNYPANYYPGSAYVDWLGLSVYGQQVPKQPWTPIDPLIEWPYMQMEKVAPEKPMMIAEWGVGQFLGSGDKAAFLKEGLDLYRKKYPHLKAAIYWHERWQNDDQSYSNLRINSSVESLRAYREGIANPDWLADLILRPRQKPLPPPRK